MTVSSWTRVDRRRFLGGAAGIGFGLALPTSFAFAQDAQRSGVLQYATLGLDTSDPHRHTGSIAVQQAYVEALTSIADDGSVEPWLAESFEVSPDGLIYTFRLRPDVRFHNGDLLNSADVAANFERVQSTISGGWLADAMRLIAAVETPDDATVIVRMSEPYAPLANLLAELWILSPRSDGWDDTITHPIGTGPFMFGEWQPNMSLTTPAFGSYWQESLPHVEAVRFDLRGVDVSMPFRAGEVHIARITDRDVAASLAADGIARLEPLKDTSFYSVAFNNRSPRAPFDNPKVRAAIFHALDRAGLMSFIGGSVATVSNQLVPSTNFYYDKALNDADPFQVPDLEKAAALLDEAGVNPADHTIRWVSLAHDYAQAAVQMIRRLGFKINHEALDDIGNQQRLAGDDWDMTIAGSGPRVDIFQRYVRLTSDGPNPVLWGNIQDPELDALIGAAVREPDAGQRRQLYLDAIKRVHEKLYFLILGHAPEQVAIATGVDGYSPGYTWASHWASGGVAHARLGA